MKKVFIKYNPYKLETEIRVDDTPLAKNSRLQALICDSRLQEWAEELPDILLEEYGDRDFNIRFHGMQADFEDLKEAFDDARGKKELTAQLKLKPAKSIAEREKLARKLFKELWREDCPFKELQTPQIKDAFEQALSSDFEVCVVATMSAGKSTLINAMLGRKLMPSKQEACTAIITRVEEEGRDGFRAEVYDKSGGLVKTIENLTYEDMKRLNEDERVSEVRAFGRIPFATTGGEAARRETSLILVDTPGPNNARNFDHKKKQREILDASSKALVVYIMTGEFGTEDDAALIDYVSESMAVKGKCSRDRFIFAINKQDERTAEDGSMERTLQGVREYLEKRGIANPELFPIAALPALNIRLLEDPSYEMDEDDREETEAKIRKLNRKKDLHLEKYAALPPSVKGDIEDSLAETRKNWKGEKNANPGEALIHSGVVSIEAAINQYICKYVKTAKIKNIADNIIPHIDELKSREELNREAIPKKILKEFSENYYRLFGRDFDLCTIDIRDEQLTMRIPAYLAEKHKIDNTVIQKQLDEIVQKERGNMTWLDSIRKKVEGLLEI